MTVVCALVVSSHTANVNPVGCVLRGGESLGFIIFYAHQKTSEYRRVEQWSARLVHTQEDSGSNPFSASKLASSSSFKQDDDALECFSMKPSRVEIS